MQLLQHVILLSPSRLTLLLVLVFQSQHKFIRDCKVRQVQDLLELPLGGLRLVNLHLRDLLGSCTRHTTNFLLACRFGGRLIFTLFLFSRALSIVVVLGFKQIKILGRRIIFMMLILFMINVLFL